MFQKGMSVMSLLELKINKLYNNNGKNLYRSMEELSPNY